MGKYGNYETTFLNQLDVANKYYEKCHYRKELDRVFSSNRFCTSMKEIYDTMCVDSWDEFRINVILETKVAIYTSLEKASRLAGGKVDLSKCEAEIILRAESVARRVAIGI